MGFKITTGSQVNLYINGAPYAKVLGFSFAVATPKREIRGIDSSDPSEFAITTQSVTGQLEIYRLTGDGGLEGSGIVAPLNLLTKEKYFSMALVDSLTDGLLFAAQNCTVENQSWDIRTKALVTGSMSFKALSWTNEASPVSVG